jgi:hypothetical protein
MNAPESFSGNDTPMAIVFGGVYTPAEADIFNMPVHPACELLPWLSDDEMAELVDAIRDHGQNQPILVQNGVLIDGKNRREACKRIGVIPVIKEIPADDDPRDVVIRENFMRRHLTEGQRAMATAIAYPEPAKGGRGNKTIPEIKEFHVNPGLVSMARTVLRYSENLANRVMGGYPPLKQAYEEVRQAIREAKEKEERRDELRRRAPDLADLVRDQKIEIDVAEELLRQRREQSRIDNVRIAKLFEALEHWAPAFEGDFADKVVRAAVHGAREGDPRALLERWHRNLGVLLDRDEWLEPGDAERDAQDEAARGGDDERTGVDDGQGRHGGDD